MDWKPYPKDRKAKDFQSCVVVVPKEFAETSGDRIPLFCEVCGFVFSNKEDEKSQRDFSCCSICADTWAYSNKEKWNGGWRPSNEQIEASIQRRLFKNYNIIFE